MKNKDYHKVKEMKKKEILQEEINFKKMKKYTNKKINEKCIIFFYEYIYEYVLFSKIKIKYHLKCFLVFNIFCNSK